MSEDKFSSFFNRNKLAAKTDELVRQEQTFPPPEPVTSLEIPSGTSPNNWDEEGIFDLDRDDSQPPLSSEISDPPNEPEIEVPEVSQPHDEMEAFFGNVEPAPKLRPGENLRRDLVYAAQAYVSSFKEGNPIPFKALAEMAGKTPAELKAAFNTTSWLHFFKMFGVEPPAERYKGHLTPRQLETLQVITNPLDSRKLNTILRERGVDPAEWRMWMRQPEFKDLYTKWMKDGMKDVQGEVARQVTAKATQGDPRAIETYLKLNGVNLQATNSDMLVPFLLRKLQQFMNQDQLASFTQELKALTSGSI